VLLPVDKLTAHTVSAERVLNIVDAEKPSGVFPSVEVDAIYLLLIKRASDLERRGDSEDDGELDCLRNAIEAVSVGFLVGAD
jgi:hypothetical protein